MRYAALLILGFILFACQDLKKDGQMKEIEQLEQKCERMEQLFSGIKADSTTLLISNALFLEEYLRMQHESDTLDLESGKKISAYKMIISQLPPALELMDTLRKRLPQMKKSLQDLKADIDKAAGDKAKYDEYIALEREKMTETETQLQNALAIRKQSLAAFSRLEGDMQGLTHKEE